MCQRFDLRTKAVATPGLLLLGMQARGGRVLQRERRLEQKTKLSLALSCVRPELQVRRVRGDARIVRAGGIAGMAGPAVRSSPGTTGRIS